MPRVFIFAEQIRDLINAGNEIIEVPEGACISAAASDLIKDHKLKIMTVAARDKTAGSTAQPEDKPLKNPAQAVNEGNPPPESISLPPDKTAASAEDLSDSELEALVDRVIERFKQLKCMEPSSSVQQQTTEAEKPSLPADDDDMIICRCEEITKGEIKSAIRNGMQTINGIKRVTRAGMGLCQGQTCQRLVTQIIAEELRQSVADIEPTTARGPVRPLRLAAFANS